MHFTKLVIGVLLSFCFLVTACKQDSNSPKEVKGKAAPATKAVVNKIVDPKTLGGNYYISPEHSGIVLDVGNTAVLSQTYIEVQPPDVAVNHWGRGSQPGNYTLTPEGILKVNFGNIIMNFEVVGDTIKNLASNDGKRNVYIKK